jgi:DNA-binding GntR family transcriptional regulator
MARSQDGGGRAAFVHRSLPDAVHAVLRDRILNNEIPAGAPLLEVALSEEFEVSRTTIRTAIRQLQAERLVEIAPRRHTIVTRMSTRDQYEVCFARYLFESVALRDLNRGMRARLADRMEPVLSDMEACAEKEDFSGMVEADTELHRKLVEAIDRPLILEMWTGLNGQMGALMRSSLDRQRISLRDTVARHVVLVEAVRTEPRGRADAALYEHYVRADGELGQIVLNHGGAE